MNTSFIQGMNLITRLSEHFVADVYEGSLIDYITVSGSMERNVLEYVDHLHEHFVNPCSINKNGSYNVPSNPDEGYRCALQHRINWREKMNRNQALKCIKRVLLNMSGQMARIGRGGELSRHNTVFCIATLSTFTIAFPLGILCRYHCILSARHSVVAWLIAERRYLCSPEAE